jgi:hypothetical protein
MKLTEIPQSWLEYAAQNQNSYQTWLHKLTVHIQHGLAKWEVNIGLSVPGITELCMLASDTHYNATGDLDWILDEIAQELYEAGGRHEP